MADQAKSKLPECGLYRTTKALPGNEEQIPAGTLVYFHNHSDAGLPQVVSADHNIMNRWHFHGPGVTFRALSWCDSLVRMPNEGFYSLRRELKFDGGSWPKGTLVQLGYTKNADAILFIAQVRAQLAENDLFFSDRGVGIQREQLSALEPLTVLSEAADEGDHGPANMH